MIPRYYDIARLQLGKNIWREGNNITVDVEQVAPEDHLLNDEMLLAARAPDAYFYLSGGGTYLVNGRYVLTVQRDAAARINPHVWSLFTGRAEGPEEWRKPLSVVRELFEELMLYQGSNRLHPHYAPLQAMIDAVYAKLPAMPSQPLPLELHTLSNSTITVKDGGVYPTFLHIGSRNDINLMQVFHMEADMGTLYAEDGEGLSRNIAALDLISGKATLVSRPNHGQTVDKDSMNLSENLTALLQRLRDSGTKGA